MMVDLGNNLKFHSEIAVTNQRPDMLIISNSTKKVGLLVELEVKECTAHRMDHTIERMLVHPGLEPPNFNYPVNM